MGNRLLSQDARRTVLASLGKCSLTNAHGTESKHVKRQVQVYEAQAQPRPSVGHSHGP